MSEVAIHQGNALAMHGEQPFWNDHQLAALRQLGVDRATNGDLAVFHHVCQRTGLDPFARQIYMIQRKGKQTIQTGIDGYRLVARRAVDRTREALSIGSAEWCGADGQWVDVWLRDEAPAAARVTVTRGQGTFPAVALWREYVQYDKDGAITSMWRTRSAGQLAKCAEALALRKAFPQDLSGVYTDDEMGQADYVRGEVVQQQTGRLSSALGHTVTAEVIYETPAAVGAEDPRGLGDVDAETTGRPQAMRADTTAAESPMLDTSSALARAMFAALGELDINSKPDRLLYVSDVIGRDIASSTEMTDAEAEFVLTEARRELAERQAELTQPSPTEDEGAGAS